MSSIPVLLEYSCCNLAWSQLIQWSLCTLCTVIMLKLIFLLPACFLWFVSVLWLVLGYKTSWSCRFLYIATFSQQASECENQSVGSLRRNDHLWDFLQRLWQRVCVCVCVCVCRTVCRILPLLPSFNTPASYLAWLPVNAVLIMLTVNWNTAINATVYDIHAWPFRVSSKIQARHIFR